MSEWLGDAEELSEANPLYIGASLPSSSSPSPSSSSSSSSSSSPAALSGSRFQTIVDPSLELSVKSASGSSSAPQDDRLSNAYSDSSVDSRPANRGLRVAWLRSDIRTGTAFRSRADLLDGERCGRPLLQSIESSGDRLPESLSSVGRAVLRL